MHGDEEYLDGSPEHEELFMKIVDVLRFDPIISSTDGIRQFRTKCQRGLWLTQGNSERST